MNIASDIFPEGSYNTKLKILCKKAMIKIDTSVIDVSKNDFRGLSGEHELSMYTFNITPDLYCTGKWWNGHRLVEMPKNFLSFCRGLKGVVNRELERCLAIQNMGNAGGARSGSTLSSITEYEDSNDGMDVESNSGLGFDIAMTSTLKVQLVAYIMGGVLAFGLCCACKQGVFYTPLDNEVDGKYKAQCMCAQPMLYQSPIEDMPETLTIRQMTEIVGDCLAQYAYDDSIVCIKSNLPHDVLDKIRRGVYKRQAIWHLVFVDKSYEFKSDPERLMCQLMLHRRLT